MLIAGSTLRSLQMLGGKIKAVSIPQFFRELRKYDDSIRSGTGGVVRSVQNVSNLGDDGAYVVQARKDVGDAPYSATVGWYTDEGVFSVFITGLSESIPTGQLADFARSIASDLSAS